ncbi:amidohydrolase family protein [Nocardioides acrostichi]|uniref:Amidohydrolase family protein n=1 Tax=Nocardioides acrostichi TaxID=2784339 RepID=A0A930Y9K0_9ACTN|nr:amidohydrolase family protein [Nocardioides acrostichi]MBF4160448.1 amidohydrolase family protein [Nocardioides acrostichi]
MTASKFTGPVLPGEESRDLYVVDGHVTYEPQPGAETEASGWIVPGLVDAHNHLGLEDGGAIGDDQTLAQAVADRDSGALVLRDCGSPADTRWVQQRDDLPRLVRAGRHIARTKRYIRNYAHEVEPDDLPAYAAQEARNGDGWIKLVGDWISREAGDLAPSFPLEAFRAAIEAAHAEGAKVTAHCFGREVLQGLLDSGIDCIEHGTGLSVDQVEQMAATGIALVPTVQQTDKFPEFAEQGREKFPTYAATMEELHAQRRETLMSAHEAGVAMYVGTDGGGTGRHGFLWQEARAMHEMGLPAIDVLAAASWAGRTWLGFDNLDEGSPADLVVYPRDPRADLSVLAEPACVVLRGRVQRR